MTIGSYPGMKWDKYEVLPYEMLYRRAIKADLALGDEDHIAVPLYKDYNGMYVKEQREIFGEK